YRGGVLLESLSLCGVIGNHRRRSCAAMVYPARQVAFQGRQWAVGLEARRERESSLFLSRSERLALHLDLLQERRSAGDHGNALVGHFFYPGPHRHGTSHVNAVAVAYRIESLFDKPALDFLDFVAPLVARQECVEAVEHLSVIPLLACHAIDTEEGQVPADPTVALLEEELDDRIETDHDRMRDEAQQARRKPVALPEGDETGGEVGHPPFWPFPVGGIDPQDERRFLLQQLAERGKRLPRVGGVMEHPKTHPVIELTCLERRFQNVALHVVQVGHVAKLGGGLLPRFHPPIQPPHLLLRTPTSPDPRLLAPPPPALPHPP